MGLEGQLRAQDTERAQLQGSRGAQLARTGVRLESSHVTGRAWPHCRHCSQWYFRKVIGIMACKLGCTWQPVRSCEQKELRRSCRNSRAGKGTGSDLARRGMAGLKTAAEMKPRFPISNGIVTNSKGVPRTELKLPPAAHPTLTSQQAFKREVTHSLSANACLPLPTSTAVPRLVGEGDSGLSVMREHRGLHWPSPKRARSGIHKHPWRGFPLSWTREQAEGSTWERQQADPTGLKLPPCW